MRSLLKTLRSALHARPAPPDELLEPSSADDIGIFVPDDNIADWVKTHIIAEAGILHNPDHLHLKQAHLGFLWTNVQNSKQGKMVAGQCERPAAQGNAWLKARVQYQLRTWFGKVPDFLITLDALYADQADDATFAALIEHELYHIAQARDMFGELRFTREGKAVLEIRGHDAEEFVGVVRRYGVGAAAGGVADLVKAAQRAPSVAARSIAEACGTCLRMVG